MVPEDVKRFIEREIRAAVAEVLPEVPVPPPGAAVDVTHAAVREHPAPPAAPDE